MLSTYFLALGLLLLSTSTGAVADPSETQTSSTSEAKFHSIDWDKNHPPVIYALRGSQISRIEEKDLRDIGSNFTVLVFAKSARKEGQHLVANDCQFVLHLRYVTMEGSAQVFDYDGDVQLATMTDAEVATDVAVTGHDLNNFASLTAKSLRLDIKNGKMKASHAESTIDFSPRE